MKNEGEQISLKKMLWDFSLSEMCFLKITFSMGHEMIKVV